LAQKRPAEPATSRLSSPALTVRHYRSQTPKADPRVRIALGEGGVTKGSGRHRLALVEPGPRSAQPGAVPRRGSRRAPVSVPWVLAVIVWLPARRANRPDGSRRRRHLTPPVRRRSLGSRGDPNRGSERSTNHALALGLSRGVSRQTLARQPTPNSRSSRRRWRTSHKSPLSRCAPSGCEAEGPGHT
jgi:hypothetical protein